MSQKFKKIQNKNDESTAYGKWFATAVYDQHFIETEELANFIQTQASVKKSDIKAVLDELGSAMKHFFELGQKVKLQHRHHREGGLRRADHHHPPCALPARDRARGRRPEGEQAGQDQPEVRRGQEPREGRDLRGDLRHLSAARERQRRHLRRRQRLKVTQKFTEITESAFGTGCAQQAKRKISFISLISAGQ